MLKNVLKKSSALTLAVLMAISLYIPSLNPISAAQNLVANGNFETGDGTSWDGGGFNPGNNFSVEYVDDTYALKVGGDNVNWQSVRQVVPVTPKTVYDFSFRYKSGTFGGCIKLFETDETTNKIIFNNNKQFDFAATSGWTTVSQRIAIPNGVTQIKIWITSDIFTDSTYIDDISVTEVLELDSSDIITNGGFENGNDGWWQVNTTPAGANDNYIDSSQKASGDYSLHLNKGQWSSTNQVVTVVPLQDYNFSFKYRTTGFGGLAQFVTGTDPNNVTLATSVLGDIEFGMINTNGVWLEYTKVVTFPSGFVNGTVIFKNADGGIWIDDASLVPIIAEADDPDNLVKNSSFEEGSTYWRDGGAGFDLGFTTGSVQGAPHGSNVLKPKTDTQGNWPFIAQYVDVEPNTVYEFGFSYNSTQARDNVVKLFPVVNGSRDETTMLINNKQQLMLPGTSGWTVYEQYVTIPTNVTRLAILFGSADTDGVCNIDKVYLKKASLSDDSIIENGNFQEGTDGWVSSHGFGLPNHPYLDFQKGYGDNLSLKLDSPDPGTYPNVRQILNVAPGRRYNVKFNYFVDGTMPGAASLKVFSGPTTDVPEFTLKNGGIQAFLPWTSDWQEHTETIDVPYGVNRILIFFTSNYPGTWIDNVSVTLNPYDVKYKITGDGGSEIGSIAGNTTVSAQLDIKKIDSKASPMVVSAVYDGQGILKYVEPIENYTNGTITLTQSVIEMAGLAGCWKIFILSDENNIIPLWEFVEIPASTTIASISTQNTFQTLNGTGGNYAINRFGASSVVNDAAGAYVLENLPQQIARVGVPLNVWEATKGSYQTSNSGIIANIETIKELKKKINA